MPIRDEVTILVEGGAGGNGCVSFRRERCAPKGGPDGGHGGKGGNIVIEASASYDSLDHLAGYARFVATSGGDGMGDKCHGKNGHDLVLRVPVGTLIRDATTQQLLKDLCANGERTILAAGGGGGKGNRAFARATRQTPRVADPGRPGEVRRVLLELKIIAEAGLIGLANAGKSSLLRAISHARPRVGAYPFTTLSPALGVIESPSFERCIVADLPGLIEGAHEGKGLGEQFLRHIERTRILIHVVDLAPPAPPNPWDAYRIVRQEIQSYGRGVDAKTEIIVGNKLDLPSAPETLERFRNELKHPILGISARTGAGIEELLQKLFLHLGTQRTL